MHYVRHVQDKMYLPPLRLTVFFAPLRFLFSLFSLFCRNISQTGNYVCTQKIFFPRGMLVTTKGKRGTGREAQAGFFSLPLVPLFLSPSFSRGGREGRLSRDGAYTEDNRHSSPLFFPLFFCICYPVSYYGVTVTHQQASLLGMYCFAPADRILPAYLTPFLLFPLPPLLYQQPFVSRTPFSPDVNGKQGGGEGKR